MGKISLDITADAGNLLTDTKQVAASVKEIGDTAQKTKEKTVNAFSAMKKAKDDEKKATQELVAKLYDEGKVTDALIVKYGTASKAISVMQKELGTLAALGKANTKEYIELSKILGQLKNHAADATTEIKKMASSTKGIDKLVETGRFAAGAFSTLAGAAALFGTESEKMQKRIAMAQGALALLTGAQELARQATEKGGIVNGFVTAFQRAYAAAVAQTTVIQEANTIATVEQTVATEAAVVATEGNAVASVVAAESTTALTFAQKLYAAATAASTLATEALTLAMSVSPWIIVALLITEVILLYKLYSIQADIARQDVLEFAADVERGEQKIRNALELSAQKRKNEIELLRAQKATAKDVHDAEIEDMQKSLAGTQQLIREKGKLEEVYRKRLLSDAVELGSEEGKMLREKLKANEEELRKLGLLRDDFNDKILINEAAFRQKQIEDERAFQNSLFELKQRAAREAEIFQSGAERINTEQKLSLAALAQLKKQVALENKERGHGNELDAEQEKQFAILKSVVFEKAARDRLALLREAQTAALGLQEDGEAKEIAATKLKYQKLIDLAIQNKKDTADIETARDREVALIIMHNIQQRDDAALALQDDGRNKELRATSIKYSKLRDLALKNKQDVTGINEAEQRDLFAIDTKFNISTIEANKAHQLALVDQTERIGMTEVAFEQFKAERKLEILKKFNELEIAIIQSQIPNLSAVEKQKAQAQIDALMQGLFDAKKSALDAAKKNKEPTIWESLFGNLKNEDGSALSKEQLDKVIAATGMVAQSVKDNLISVLDDLVAAEQRYIDVLDTRISKQEDVVARQQELENQGIANSLSRETDKLNKLNAARDKAIKKQQSIRTAQAAIDTATQLSSLVTAAAQVFAAYAGIVGGTAIAGALVGVMFAAFAAAKVTAGVLAGRSDGFREGGYTGDGDPSDTSTKLGNRGYKYHKKEFVFDEEKTARHRDFFEALHKDDKLGIIHNIGDLLKDTGVSLPDRNLPTQLIFAKTEHDKLSRDENNEELKLLRGELSEIKEHLKMWEGKPVEHTTGVGDTLVSKKGNRTVIKKTK